jgi:hypothetical protein
MAETLAQSLRTTSPPTDPTAALLRGNSIQSRGTEARKQFPSLLEESATAAGELKRSELQAESQKAGREATALEESGRKMREETGRIRKQEQPYQEFKAPEYSAFDYAKGAATRALTAVILGGVAKTSALTQLKAIKAMQDAEKEGRQNDFLNAQLTFNEAEKKRVDFNERLKRDLDDFEKLLQTDTKTALAKAKVMTSDMQDGLVKRLIDSQRFGEAIKVARNNIETAEELEKQLTIRSQEAASRERLEGIKAEAKAAAPGRAGQYALTYASRVYGNIQNAYQDLENIQNLPAIAQSPVLSGMINRDPETAFSSMTALVGRKVTNPEARAFDQVANSLSAALARLESQGLASGGTKANIAAFDAVKPRAGDDAINMALYIARVKQEIQVGINVHDKMPGATPEQKQEAKQILRELDRIVPFNTNDVMNVLRGSNRPMNEKMTQMLNKPPVMQQIKPSTIEKDGKVYELNPETGKYREREGG